jgi:hypothetical protein
MAQLDDGGSHHPWHADTTRTPTRLDVATWVAGTMEEMRGEGAIIHNAWKKMKCEWFDDAKE